MPAKKKTPLTLAPVTNKDGSVTVYFQVTSCTPDSVQYKPYSTLFAPVSPMFVPVTVRPEHVLVQTETYVVLSPQGWFMVARTLATAAVLAAGANIR